MDIQTLLRFMDVYEQASISKAADMNYISRQSLAKAMTKLEKEVDATLFTRHRYGVTPTSEGRYFYKSLKSIIPSWTYILDGLGTLQGDARIIHFAATLALLSDETICRLLKDEQEMKDRVLVFHDAATQECINMLNTGEADIAYTTNALEDNNFVYTPITTHLEGTYLLVQKGSHLASLPSIAIDCLKGEPIQYPDLKSISGARLSEYIRKADAIFVHSPNMHNVQIRLVEAGVGSLVVPGSALTEFASPGVVAKRITDIPIPSAFRSRAEHPGIIRKRDCDPIVEQTSQFLYRFFLDSLYRVRFDELENGTIVFL